MRVFRNTVFFILLFAGLVGMSGWIQKTMMNNSDYVPTRNKNVYQILKEPENSICWGPGKQQSILKNI